MGPSESRVLTGEGLAPVIRWQVTATRQLANRGEAVSPEEGDGVRRRAQERPPTGQPPHQRRGECNPPGLDKMRREQVSKLRTRYSADVGVRGIVDHEVVPD